MTGTNPKNPAQTPESGPTASRTIACTPENAPEFRAAIQNWPELGQLIKSLQAQDLFPGLRALKITVTGTPEQVAQGLGSIATEKTPTGPQNPPAQAAPSKKARS